MAVCSIVFTVVIPQTQDLTDIQVSKCDLSRKNKDRGRLMLSAGCPDFVSLVLAEHPSEAVPN